MKFATRVRFAEILKVKLALVETGDPASVQLTNLYPEAGEAVTVAEAPESYVPVPVVVPPAAGLEEVVIE